MSVEVLEYLTFVITYVPFVIFWFGIYLALYHKSLNYECKNEKKKIRKQWS